MRRKILVALIDKNRLVLNITSDQRDLRSVSAPAPAFMNGAWVTLAFKWDLDAGGKTQMAIYADGKEISGGKINAWNGKDGSVAMPMRDEGNVTMQVGCLNSGGWPATGFFKDFRLSSAASGELSFGFDGTLDGFSGAKDAGQIKAHVGTMRR